MSYYLHKDAGFEDDQLDHGCVSLAGIIKLQPNRKKGNKTWRPMQASDLRESTPARSHIGDASLQSHDTEDMDSGAEGSVLPKPLDRFQRRPFMPLYALSDWGHLGNLYDGANTFEDLAALSQADPEGARQSEMPYGARESYLQVFGNLPDPIRLHEQMGEFDGQVVFIGHPNRDVSAHQWSSSSFQWVNIGRYVHSSDKVEGSLASDRLRGINEHRDLLERFKLAAENRETLIVQNGRQKNHFAIIGPELQGGMDVVESTNTYTSVSLEASQDSVNMQSSSGSSLPSTVRAPIRRDFMEDPFVAATGNLVTQSKNGNFWQGDLIGSTGSLDLTYRFPMKMAMGRLQSNVGTGTCDRKSTQNQDPGWLSASILKEIAFGEDASTKDRGPHVGSELNRGLPLTALQEPFRGRSQLSTNAEGSKTSTPLQDSVNPTAQYAFAPPSSASLTCMSSNLNATAVPYARIQTVATASRASESNASTINAPAVGLHYSDPDGLRKTQTYEVTNGLGQQAPTLRNFKGPFFTETKPTTHDPTVALSVQISEEEKLVNWFHDGHRPARQKEYTRSLIAAAVASGTARHFGAIGEASAAQGGPYANTAPFVRLYENLSEYVEEYRNGSRQSYFTRRWKPAASHLRGLGPDDNMSYFVMEGTAPHVLRGAILRPSGPIWG